MDPDNFLGNIDFVTAEELYKRYRKDPLSVDRSWHDFFKGFDLALARYGESAVLPESLKKEFNVLKNSR